MAADFQRAPARRGRYGADYGVRRGRYGGDFRPRRRQAQRGFGGRPGRWQLVRGSDADRVRARDVMTYYPEIVTPETSIADGAKKMRALNVGILPVVDSPESRRLKGVLTDRDITIRAVAEGKDGTTPVSECMSTFVESVHQDDSILDVLDVMGREQVRRVPVTDRAGRLVGIIAQADVAVDFAEAHPRRERITGETLAQISEPARPRRGRGRGWGR